MATVTLSVCDVCKAEQRSDVEVYWTQKHAICDYNVPRDGGNHGKLVGDNERVMLCEPCRRAIDAAVRNVVTARQPPAETERGT